MIAVFRSRLFGTPTYSMGVPLVTAVGLAATGPSGPTPGTLLPLLGVG